jgi:flagellar hook-basal body protein
MGAFSIPLSGLAAASSELDVIGNNLANLNTDGYKDESLTFSDIFNQMQGQSGNGDPIEIGSGVNVAATTTNFSNGSPDATGISSNMALQGNGFFVVENPTTGQAAYTRDGSFTTNSQGQLTDKWQSGDGLSRGQRRCLAKQHACAHLGEPVGNRSGRGHHKFRDEYQPRRFGRDLQHAHHGLRHAGQPSNARRPVHQHRKRGVEL